MSTSSGKRDKFITIQNPSGEPVPTGEGDYTQEYADFAKVFASIEPATARSLERFRANTVIATASDIVTIPFMAGITTQTQIKYRDRLLQVRGYADPTERSWELILACEELAQPTVLRGE